MLDSDTPMQQAADLILRSQGGKPIRSVDEWYEHAPPKKPELHWKDGRSAKELAKAWFQDVRPAPPVELRSLFASHPATKDVSVLEGVPECRLRLDNLKGEKRNADLWLWCNDPDGVAITTIEAKADESFGDEIGPYYDSKLGTRSSLPARIDALCNAVFGRGLTAEIRSLRYQLLHGVAATLISAKDHRAAKAIFVVHEFHSSRCREAAVLRNRTDWRRFLSALKLEPPGGQTTECDPALFRVVGPAAIPGGEFVPPGIPLFLGYVRTDLASPD